VVSQQNLQRQSSPKTRASTSNAAELQEDLGLLDAPPMVEREIGRWQRCGDLVYGDGADSFETDWP